MIEVAGVSKRYGEIVAVNDVNFTFESGHIYGLLGPNGAGKTTVMSIITGCLAATDGTVRINGHDIYEQPYEAKRYLGYLPEIPPVYPEMTPVEYLRFVGEAKGIKRAELGEQVASAAERTRITDVQHRLIRNLSKGYRQRVGFAQAIIGYPETIILDEPTVGLDPLQIIEIRELIRDLGKDHTVILSSHILSEVSAVCDRILIISKGNLVASDTAENLRKKFENNSSLNLTVRGAPEKIKAALKKAGGVTRVKMTKPDADGLIKIAIRTDAGTDRRDGISKALVNADCLILSMSQSSMSLEEIFLYLTKEKETEPPEQGDVPESPSEPDEGGEEEMI